MASARDPSISRPAELRTVLIVEDDAGVRDVAETILAEEGYRVLVASDGVSAFSVFERDPDIALLFTDIMMPRIDGLMLADMARLRRPGIRILYATAYQAEASRQPGYRYGEVLAKPYRRDELLGAVARTLQAPARAIRPAFVRTGEA